MLHHPRQQCRFERGREAAYRPMRRLASAIRYRPSAALHALRRLSGDQSGATAVEFAIVSVPFLGLLFAIFQTSLAFFMQQGLVAAVDNASRQVLIGSVQANAGITTWQNFRDQLICPATATKSLWPSFMSCSSLVVDVRTATSFTSTSSNATNDSFLFDGSGPQFKPGCQGQIVVVRVAYPMPAFLPLLTSNGGGGVIVNKSGLTSYNGSLVQMLTTASVFRNEPFGTPGSCTS